MEGRGREVRCTGSEESKQAQDLTSGGKGCYLSVSRAFRLSEQPQGIKAEAGTALHEDWAGA